uniref:Uncharacterized protein n=1 Tax=Physcomitrium patens TaxID=3218 RepID=A0A2K1IU86_PHYPA|nr:hypothetical protein PHYPA_024785 [Physcomitrium patens]
MCKRVCVGGLVYSMCPFACFFFTTIHSPPGVHSHHCLCCFSSCHKNGVCVCHQVQQLAKLQTGKYSVEGGGGKAKRKGKRRERRRRRMLAIN